MKTQKPLLFVITLLTVTLGHLNIYAEPTPEIEAIPELISLSVSPRGFAQFISYIVQSGHAAELRKEFFTSFTSGNKQPLIQLLEAYLYALQNPDIHLYPQKLQSQNSATIISFINFVITSLQSNHLTADDAHIQVVISALDTADVLLNGLSEDKPEPLSLP